MMLNLRYLLNLLLLLPLLPVLIWQGKQIRLKVPELPPAEGESGSVSEGEKGSVGEREWLRLVAMGESTIAGIGVATHEEGFTGTLARKLAAELKRPVSWKVLARSGYTAAKVQEKLVGRLDGAPDLIVIGLGGNDTFRFNPPWRWRRHIQELVDAIRQRQEKVPIIFTNMPPVGLFPAVTPLLRYFLARQVRLLGKALKRQVAGQAGVYYYDQPITWADWRGRLGVEASPEDFFSDGVHPSRLTYQIWAEDIGRFVVQQAFSP